MQNNFQESSQRNSNPQRQANQAPIHYEVHYHGNASKSQNANYSPQMNVTSSGNPPMNAFINPQMNQQVNSQRNNLMSPPPLNAHTSQKSAQLQEQMQNNSYQMQNTPELNYNQHLQNFPPSLHSSSVMKTHNSIQNDAQPMNYPPPSSLSYTHILPTNSPICTGSQLPNSHHTMHNNPQTQVKPSHPIHSNSSLHSGPQMHNSPLQIHSKHFSLHMTNNPSVLMNSRVQPSNHMYNMPIMDRSESKVQVFHLKQTKNNLSEGFQNSRPQQTGETQADMMGKSFKFVMVQKDQAKEKTKKSRKSQKSKEKNEDKDTEGSQSATQETDEYKALMPKDKSNNLQASTSMESKDNNETNKFIKSKEPPKKRRKLAPDDTIKTQDNMDDNKKETQKSREKKDSHHKKDGKDSGTSNTLDSSISSITTPVYRGAYKPPPCPFQVSSTLTIHSFGDAPSEIPSTLPRYIFLTNYKAVRRYDDYKSPSEKTNYTMFIDNNGKFNVVYDKENIKFTAENPTLAWKEIVDIKNANSNSNSNVDGPNKFGVTEDKVKRILCCICMDRELTDEEWKDLKSRKKKRKQQQIVKRKIIQPVAERKSYGRKRFIRNDEEEFSKNILKYFQEMYTEQTASESQCYVCKKEVTDGSFLTCKHKGCYKKYHPSCINSEYMSKSTLDLVCPHHYCCNCGISSVTMQCSLCPNAFCVNCQPIRMIKEDARCGCCLCITCSELFCNAIKNINET